MHKMMATVLAVLLCITVAQAQDKKPGEQAATPASPKISSALIKKMRDCRKNAEKKQLKGDARKIFVSRCIDGSDAAPRIAAARAAARKPTIGHCKRQAWAKELKGEEFKKFIAECLKG